MKPKSLRWQVKELSSKGMTIKEIARTLGLSYHQVYHLLHYDVKREKGDWRREYLDRLKEAGLDRKLQKLLTYKETRKGREVYLTLAEIKRRIEVELAVHGINPLGKTRWYEFLRFFLSAEMGMTWKQFIAKRKNKVLPKGSITREKGILEIDATGFTLGGKNYSVFFALDVYSGFILSYTVVENKEKNAKHYNKAFDRFDVAKFLQDTFLAYGLPVAVKSDNEKVIKNRHVMGALARLGVKHIKTIPGQPQQKLIENVIGNLKKYTVGFETDSITDFLDYAVNRWNAEAHKFKHLDRAVVPVEVFPQEAYRKVDDEEILKAFAVRERKVLRNNSVSVNGITYEFVYPGRLEVEVLIYLDDNTKAYLYNAETGEYLGVARKISQSLGDTVVEESQLRRKAKRIERRKRKYQEEIQKLEKEAVKPAYDEISIPLEKDSSIEESTPLGDVDLLKILAGGNNDD